MSQGVMDFPRQAIALPGFRRPLRLDRIGAEPLVRVIELRVQRLDALALAMLALHQYHHIEHEQDRIERKKDIQQSL